MPRVYLFFQNRWFQSERLENEITGEVHHFDEFGHDPYKDVVVVSRCVGKEQSPLSAPVPLLGVPVVVQVR
jgi:hypothetical protein